MATRCAARHLRWHIRRLRRPDVTLGEITLIDRKSIEIRARPLLKIAYFGDSELIPEGKSYRVEIGDPDSTTPPTIKALPHPTGRRKFILLFLIGGAAFAAATAVGFTRS